MLSILKGKLFHRIQHNTHYTVQTTQHICLSFAAAKKNTASKICTRSTNPSTWPSLRDPVKHEIVIKHMSAHAHKTPREPLSSARCRRSYVCFMSSSVRPYVPQKHTKTHKDTHTRAHQCASTQFIKIHKHQTHITY